MERNVSLIIFLLFIPRSIRELLLLTYWWQVKEYRFDRFKVFMKMKDGARSLISPVSWLKLFVLLSFPLAFKVEGYLGFLVLIVGLLFLFDDLDFAYEMIKRKIRKPIFTLRAKRIIEISGTLMLFAIAAGSVFNLLNNSFSWAILLLTIDRLIFFFVLIGVSFTQILVNRTKKREVSEAKMCIDKALTRGMLSVGITGSYGKTSTKEFLVNILSSNFKVTATSGSENTEFGIARKIKANLKENTEVFVSEMGAYKMGEIIKLTDIVRPTIGIITGISPQHFELFGSMQNLKKAKYELVESLPQKGVAIFNGNSKHCLSLAKRRRPQRTIIYKIGRFRGKGSDVLWADQVEVNKDKISFRTHWEDKVVRFEVNLLGEQFVEDILGASAAALLLGMSLDKIANAVKTLRAIPRTMEAIISTKEFLIIDDSFNSNPAGFNAALDFLEKVKFRKKIVVTPGIIELGKESAKIHEELGTRLAKIVDNVFLTSYDFDFQLRKGMGKSAEKLTVEKNVGNLFKMLTRLLKKGDVLLIEGRIPESIRMEFIK